MKKLIVVVLLMLMASVVYADNYVYSQIGDCTVVTDTTTGKQSTIWKM